MTTSVDARHGPYPVWTSVGGECDIEAAVTRLAYRFQSEADMNRFYEYAPLAGYNLNRNTNRNIGSLPGGVKGSSRNSENLEET
jgi:hypothetical protein